MTENLTATHPIAVSKIVETVDHTPEMVMAALLHDVVEDTDVTFKEIQRTVRI